MEMRRIGIIGVGNLGTRHLQALALSEEAYQITVTDVRKEALAKAESVFTGTEGAAKHEVRFVTSIAAMPERMDVVIVATGSDVRRAVTEELLLHADVSYLILEKVLFQRLGDYDAVEELFRQKGIKAFVNCPRRMYPVYVSLKETLCDAKEMEIAVSGSDWGLGSNAIHMLDLIAYLAGSEAPELSCQGLDPAYRQSKRDGFLEITGTIRGRMGRCRAFSVSSYETAGVPASTFIAADTCRIHIMEGNKELEYAAVSTGWEWKKERFDMPYQSQLTHLAAAELLTGGTCRLTTFEESGRLHRTLLRQLIPYFERQGVKAGLCPIT